MPPDDFRIIRRAHEICGRAAVRELPADLGNSELSKHEHDRGTGLQSACAFARTSTKARSCETSTHSTKSTLPSPIGSRPRKPHGMRAGRPRPWNIRSRAATPTHGCADDLQHLRP
jgi:hypothetical protein